MADFWNDPLVRRQALDDMRQRPMNGTTVMTEEQARDGLHAHQWRIHFTGDMWLVQRKDRRVIARAYKPVRAIESALARCFPDCAGCRRLRENRAKSAG